MSNQINETQYDLVCGSENKMIGTICREYRLEKGASLAELANETTNYQTLYSFEHNKSTNYHHLKTYLRLASSFGEIDILLDRLLEELQNG